MRISDWSSDVCSSDLVLPRGEPDLGRRYPPRRAPAAAPLELNDGLHGPLPPSHQTLRRPRRARRARPRSGARRAGGDHRPERFGQIDLAARPAALGAARQVGRAACSDRMWRALSMKVSLVYVKKNKLI